MQDPNEDTEWNDALRKHGILPARPKTPEIEDPDPVDDKQKDVGTDLDDIDRLEQGSNFFQFFSIIRNIDILQKVNLKSYFKNMKTPNIDY